MKVSIRDIADGDVLYERDELPFNIDIVVDDSVKLVVSVSREGKPSIYMSGAVTTRYDPHTGLYARKP